MVNIEMHTQVEYSRVSNQLAVTQNFEGIEYTYINVCTYIVNSIEGVNVNSTICSYIASAEL